MKSGLVGFLIDLFNLVAPLEGQARRLVLLSRDVLAVREDDPAEAQLVEPLDLLIVVLLLFDPLELLHDHLLGLSVQLVHLQLEATVRGGVRRVFGVLCLCQLGDALRQS